MAPGRGLHAAHVVLFSLCVVCSASNLPRPNLLRTRRAREEHDRSPPLDASGALLDDVRENSLAGHTHAPSWLLPFVKLAKEATLIRSPGLWIIVTTIYVTHTRGRRDKKEEMREIRDQVFLGKDYHIAIVTTAALPWMTGTVRNSFKRWTPQWRYRACLDASYLRFSCTTLPFLC